MADKARSKSPPRVTAGRIVTYRGDGGREFPAIVSRVLPRLGDGDDVKELVDLVVFDHRQVETGGTIVRERVRHDRATRCLKHSWRWPLRVEEEAVR